MTQPAAARSDQYGNRSYPIPNPDTSEPEDLWSVTRIQGLLNKPALTTWKMKMVATGLSKRPDLVALAATDPYNASKQAIDAGKDAANMGTAVHALTEQADDGTITLDEVPEAARSHVDHYIDAMNTYGWTVVAAEQTVYHHGLGYAGTFDRILDLPGVGRVVADIKTGKGVYPDVAYQLAALAGGLGIWDAVNQQHLPMPEGIRRDLGVVIHLTPKGCRLVPVELDTAWDRWVDLCNIRRFQTGDTPLGDPLEPAPGGALLANQPVDRVQWITNRVQGLVDNGHGTALAAHWPTNLPTLKANPNPNPETIDAIAAVCDLVEANEDVGFGPNDPQIRNLNERAEQLVADLSELPDDLLAGVTADAQRHAVPNLRNGTATVEHLALITGWLKTARKQWVTRQNHIASMTDDLDDAQWHAITSHFDTMPTYWTQDEVERAEALVAALQTGLIGVEIGELSETQATLDSLVEATGSKRALLTQARELAEQLDRPKPSSSADAASDPLLAALIAQQATQAA